MFPHAPGRTRPIVESSAETRSETRRGPAPPAPGSASRGRDRPRRRRRERARRGRRRRGPDHREPVRGDDGAIADRARRRRRTPLGRNRTRARELVSDISAAPTERRRRLFAAAVRSAASAAATSLSARLAFAMARRGGTQEEAAALFVAAARGLGCRARTVAALDPTPLRASAATLEAAGVLERHARASKGSKKTKGSKGSKAKTNASMDSKAKTRAPAADAPPPTPIFRTSLLVSPDRTRAPSRVGRRCCARRRRPTPRRDGCAWCRTRWARRTDGVSRRARRAWTISRGGGGSVVAPPAPYVVAFRPLPNVAGSNPTSDAFDAKTKTSLSSRLSRVGSSPAWGAKDVTRKYAETFSRVPRAQGGTRVVVRATAAAEARERASDARFDHAAAAACAAEDDDMDVRAKNERVPTTLAELRNHPPGTCSPSVSYRRRVQRRVPAKTPRAGFVAGECVWPRSLVRELKSAERWKIEAHRAVRADPDGDAARASAQPRVARADQSRGGGGARAGGRTPPRRPGWRPEGGRGRGRGGRAAARDPSRRSPPPWPRVRIPPKNPRAIFRCTVGQTDPWDPPAAKNGVVPKNERGNVHLVGAKALPPPGTTHVNLPRITRVARTLRGCDYAPALVGFERRRGGQCARFDGGSRVRGVGRETARRVGSGGEGTGTRRGGTTREGRGEAMEGHAQRGVDATQSARRV